MTGGLRAPLLELIRALAAAGVPGTPDRTATFLRAVALLGAGRPEGAVQVERIRRAAIATLLSRPEDRAVLDAVLRRWSAGSPVAGPDPSDADEPGGAADPDAPAGTDDAPASDQRDDDGGRSTGSDGPVPPPRPPAQPPGALASAREVLRRSDTAELDAPALQQVLAAVDRLPVRDPQRRGRRRSPHRRGDVDRPRTTRALVAAAGEPVPLRRRRPRPVARRVLLVLDVSGSMQPWEPVLLALAHRWVQRLRRVEVFTAGTRLTRITLPLRPAGRVAAVAAARGRVPDLGGGTRIGENLQQLLATWGRRGAARGAVVVIVSDGWERPPLQPLVDAVAGLAALAHRVVWVIPQLGRQDYRPVQAGIVAVREHVDVLLAGHSLAALEQLTAEVAGA